MITRFMRHRLALLTVVVGGVTVMAGGAAIAGGAFAASGSAAHRHVATRHSERWQFSIFSHPSTIRAHRADAGKVSAPQGAVLAGVTHVDGETDELYAWHKTPLEDCLVDVEGGSELTVGCSPSWAAEAEGMSWVGTNTTAARPGSVGVVAMVPDGVSKIEVTGADGSTTDVEVVNNVADDPHANIKEFRYILPDGTVVSHTVGSFLHEDELQLAH